MVHRDVGLLKNGGKFELAWSHLIVAGFYRNSQQMALVLNLPHELNHALRDATKVVILHLLALRRGMTNQGSTGHYQIRTSVKKGVVNQKVLLLPAQGCMNLGYVLIKVLANRRSCLVNGLKRTQQGRLVV